ncbi:MAG: hypothetical protein JSV94_05000 [Methanobacteriota archaeon]|nr:MAG: hypothetical protein JSV94_05000 [Euryarchaeota archaeon]
MTASPRRNRKGLEGVSRLDEFGIVDDKEVRFKTYASAASKLSPKERAAWWRDVFQRDREMLEYINEHRP